MNKTKEPNNPNIIGNITAISSTIGSCTESNKIIIKSNDIHHIKPLIITCWNIKVLDIK